MRGAVRKTNEKFQEEAKIKNQKVTVVGEYIGSNKRITVRCNICGKTYDMFACAVLQGYGCKSCSDRKGMLAYSGLNYADVAELFRKRGYQLVTKKEDIVSFTRTRLHYLCPIHGERTITWGSFRDGSGCSLCAHALSSKNQLKDFNVIKSEFESRGYTLLTKKEEYTGAFGELKYICPRHGEKITKWSTFDHGTGCAECAYHRCESKIAQQLKEYCKKTYPDTIVEYKAVKNPKTGRYMPFDIYIPSEKLFCEVMGSQHYSRIKYFHRTEEDFIKQFERDNIKEKYADEHGRYIEIDLRRIKTIDEAIEHFESLHNSWISKWAAALAFPELAKSC